MGLNKKDILKKIEDTKKFRQEAVERKQQFQKELDLLTKQIFASEVLVQELNSMIIEQEGENNVAT